MQFKYWGRYLGVDFHSLPRTVTLVRACVLSRFSYKGLIESAQQILSKEDTFKATGLQFMEINTLYQLLAVKRSP